MNRTGQTCMRDAHFSAICDQQKLSKSVRRPSIGRFIAVCAVAVMSYSFTELMAQPAVAMVIGQETAAIAEDLDTQSEVTQAIDFTRDLTDRANAAFTNTTNADQQLANFQAVLNEGLALDFLGRFMLGESRDSLNADQAERYSRIFPIYITKLYAEQFKDIAGKELTINDATSFGRRDVIVRTQFLRDDGSPVNVDWRARKLKEDGHKMIDIIVSGVSIMTVKREEFSSFIAANGVDALIERLELEAQA